MEDVSPQEAEEMERCFATAEDGMDVQGGFESGEMMMDRGEDEQGVGGAGRASEVMIIDEEEEVGDDEMLLRDLSQG